MRDRVAHTKYQIADTKRSCAEFEAQIVQSPDRLRRTIAGMNQRIGEERAQYDENQRKAIKLKNKAEMLGEVEKCIDKLVKNMEDVDVESQRVREASVAAKGLEEEVACTHSELQRLETQQLQVVRQVELTNEKILRMQKAVGDKHETVKSTISQAKEMEKECEKEAKVMQSKVMSNEEMCRQFEEKTSAALQKHDAGMSEMQAGYDDMLAQMRSYHSSIRAHMQSVAA